MRNIITKPQIKPDNPNFSSGPCTKRPGWESVSLDNEVLGRSHRSDVGKAKLAEVIRLSTDILAIPKNYRVGIVPASDTGAVEMALWSLLGPKVVDIFAWESFSLTWLNDIVKQLKLRNNQYTADYGKLPDLSQYNSVNDTVFVFNGTTSGVRVPNLDWIDNNRKGLTICDATSAVFSQQIDFNKLDVTTWSWQKSLGGEAGHGMIALSERAVERLENYTPPWPMPKIFTMVKNGRLNEGIFQGSTINTPSMICINDVIDSMQWVKSIGGQNVSQEISDKNLAIVSNWVDKTDWIDFLAEKKSNRSNTSICLNITDPKFRSLNDINKRSKIKEICDLLAHEKVAYDINAYKSAPAGLRIWGGATVEPKNVTALLPWIEWAFNKVI